VVKIIDTNPFSFKQVFIVQGCVPAAVLPGADPVPQPGFDPRVLHAAGAPLLHRLQHSPPHTLLASLQLPGGGPHLPSGQIRS
jgi:hypothetical protein